MLGEEKPQVESSGCFDWKVVGGRSNVVRGTRNSWRLENTDSNLSGKILFVGCSNVPLSVFSHPALQAFPYCSAGFITSASSM